MAMKGLGSINPKAGNNDSLKIDEIVDVYQLTKEALDWANFRLLPYGILSVGMHWVSIITPKEKKEINIPKVCLRHNPEDDEKPLDVHCPYCDLDSSVGGKAGVAYYVNAIVRDLQDNQPRKFQKPSSSEKKSGMIDIKSKTWTPIRVIRLTAGLATKLTKLAGRNIHKKKPYPVDDVKYGIDLGIMYDAKAAGVDKYQLDKGSKTPLTKDEKKYLFWDLNVDILAKIGLETPEEAKKEFKKLEFQGGSIIDDSSDDSGSDGSDDSSDDDSDDVQLGKKSSKKKSSKSKKSSKKSSKKKSKKDDSDDSDDEPPVKKKKKSSKSKSRSKDKKSSSKDKKKSSSKDKKSSSKDKSSKKKKKAKF